MCCVQNKTSFGFGIVHFPFTSCFANLALSLSELRIHNTLVSLELANFSLNNTHSIGLAADTRQWYQRQHRFSSNISLLAEGGSNAAASPPSPGGRRRRPISSSPSSPESNKSSLSLRHTKDPFGNARLFWLSPPSLSFSFSSLSKTSRQKEDLL